MMEIEHIVGSVCGQRLCLEQATIAADTIDYLTARFSFSEDWDGAEKFAFFAKSGQEDEPAEVPLTDDAITEAQHLNLTAGRWKVWLVGLRTEGAEITQRITTTVAEIRVQLSGVTDGEPFPGETGSAGEQIVAQAIAARNAAQAAAQNAGASANAAAEAAVSAAMSEDNAQEYAEAAEASAQTAAANANSTLSYKNAAVAAKNAAVTAQTAAEAASTTAVAAANTATAAASSAMADAASAGASAAAAAKSAQIAEEAAESISGAIGKIEETDFVSKSNRAALYGTVIEDKAYTFADLSTAAIPTEIDGNAAIDGGEVKLAEIGGKSVKWNQIIKSPDFSDLSKWQYVDSVENGVAVRTATVRYQTISQSMTGWASFKTNHKYYYRFDVKCEGRSNSSDVTVVLNNGAGQGVSPIPVNDDWNRIENIWSNTTVGASFYLRVQDNRTSGWTTIYAKNPRVVDITEIYGAGNEPTTVEQLITENPWIDTETEYSDGSLASSVVGGVKVDGWTFALPSTQTLRSAGDAADVIRFVKQAPGTWNIEKVQNIAAIDLGTRTWIYSAVQKFFYFSGLGAKPLASTSVVANALADTYATATSAQIYNDAPSYNMSLGTSVAGSQLYLSNQAYTDAAALRTALSGVILNYELATPIVTTIAEGLREDQIATLAELGGSIEIVGNTTNAHPSLAVAIQTAIPGGSSDIPDIAEIRRGAALGATAVQPEAGKGLFSGRYADLTGKPTIPAPTEYVTHTDEASVNITLADNTEYTITDCASITLAYPTGRYEAFISVTFGTDVSLTFPAGTKYIGDVPTFAAGETWEISVKNGVVIAGKVE